MEARPLRLHAPPVGARIHDIDLDELAIRHAERATANALRTPSAEEVELAEMSQVGAELESVTSSLLRVTEELDAAHTRLQEELPAFAVQLAVGIAQEILRQEMDSGNYDIEAIVRSTLAVANTGRSACTIHLNPEDVAAIDSTRFRSNTRFESDPDIARGDVHVSTPQGLLVRDIDATLTRVREELLEATR